MRRVQLVLIGLAGAVLSGCAQQPLEPPPPPPAPDTVSAELRDRTGRIVATASAFQVGDGIRVRIDGTSVPQGPHGAHVHTTGRCDAPAFESAGPHWNPTGSAHGKDNPQGMHKGDLPNLLVGTDGRGSLEFTITGASIRGSELALQDADGASILIHANADDYRTDPSGNSGGRIACGVFQ